MMKLIIDHSQISLTEGIKLYWMHKVWESNMSACCTDKEKKFTTNEVLLSSNSCLVIWQ